MKGTQVGGVSNYIVSVEWRITGTDASGNIGFFDGVTPFPPPTDPNAVIVPYDQLGKDTVVGWIQAAIADPLHPGYQAMIDRVIGERIAEKLQKVVPMPWAPAPVEQVAVVAPSTPDSVMAPAAGPLPTDPNVVVAPAADNTNSAVYTPPPVTLPAGMINPNAPVTP